MPSNKAGKSSARGTGRKMGDHKGIAGGQIHTILTADTRYPDLHNQRRPLRGNGDTPGNPFGKPIPKPNAG